MATFQVGQVVRLKSGGPSMTVSTTGDYSPTGPTNGVLCVWFVGTKKFEDVFDEGVLELMSGGVSTPLRRS